MGYSRENIKKIKERFAEKRRAARTQSERRTEELEQKYPELKKLDSVIRETGVRIVEAAISGGDVKAKMEQLEREYDETIGYRRVFLKTYGYPDDYFDVKYDCVLCSDEGFDENGRMCVCMKRALALATYESSGIGKLITKQSFDNFRLELYRAGTERENMRLVFEKCKDYAANFGSKTCEHMLFCGNTGLGKTHLSTSVAKCVIDRGFDVVYETAQGMFDDFEREKFTRDYSSARQQSTEKYFSCDLLIIDDLGTELKSQFTISCLYNIINTRLNNDKPMIISTNLERGKLRERYEDRITSRLFGEFSVLPFVGEDIRIKSLDD